MSRRSWSRIALTLAGAVVAVQAAPASSAAEEWLWPVRGAVITSYANDNSRPYAGGMHRGIDIAAPVGAGVEAARAGRVTFAGAVGSSGLTIAIATGDGSYVASYLHLSSIAVERGDAVGAGQKIGEVGTSGKRSAAQPHLHFGVRRAGRTRSYVDPLALLPPLPGGGSVHLAPPAAPLPVRPQAQAAPVPARVRPAVAKRVPAMLKPVPAGLPRPVEPPVAARRPVRRRAPSPGAALTPEPAHVPALGWGQPVTVAGLLLLCAVLGRRLVRGASSGAYREPAASRATPETSCRESGPVRGQNRPQPSPRPAPAVVPGVGSVSQVG
jgi:peptidase M23-like protein